LFFFDFPKPNVDDLFYTGAAMNLARGHDLSNPLLARNEFPSHYFFVYPPLHSFALAAWLKLFGFSTASMIAFPLLCYFIIAASTIAILRRNRSAVWLEWLVPFGVTAVLLPVGLRPEPLAIALTMSGLAILDVDPESPFILFLGCLLMLLGASVAPRVTFFAFALFASSVIEKLRSPTFSKDRLRGMAVVLALAAGCTVLIFLFQINFHLLDFWRLFRLHSTRVTTHKFSEFLNFVDDSVYFRVTLYPVFFTCVGLLLFAWLPPDKRLTRTAFSSFLAFPIVAVIGGFGAGTAWFMILGALLYSAAVVQRYPGIAGKMAIVLAGCLIIANLLLITTCLGMLHGNIEKTRGDEEAQARAIKGTPAHPVLIDSVVARYIYDYKIPDGFFDIQFSAPFPKSHIVGELRPGDVFVIGPENVDILISSTHLDVQVPKWVPLAMEYHHFERQPCAVFIIPEEACGELRWKLAK
jgi:hypothetical protein